MFEKLAGAMMSGLIAPQSPEERRWDTLWGYMQGGPRVDTLRTAAKIPGARVTIMKEIGHFPMSENPTQFRRYLLPMLDEIRSAR